MSEHVCYLLLLKYEETHLLGIFFLSVACFVILWVNVNRNCMVHTPAPFCLNDNDKTYTSLQTVRGNAWNCQTIWKKTSHPAILIESTVYWIMLSCFNLFHALTIVCIVHGKSRKFMVNINIALMVIQLSRYCICRRINGSMHKNNRTLFTLIIILIYILYTRIILNEYVWFMILPRRVPHTTGGDETWTRDMDAKSELWTNLNIVTIHFITSSVLLHTCSLIRCFIFYYRRVSGSLWQQVVICET